MYSNPKTVIANRRVVVGTETYDVSTTIRDLDPGEKRTMFGIETLGPTAQAVAIVGGVLVEAMVLYVAYGGLMRAVEPHVRRALGGR